MSDVFISRDKVIDAIEREFGDEARPECISAKEAVYSVELADVAPVVHGHWVNRYYHPMYVCGCGNCSICGIVSPATNYCSNCGAKMDESEDKE